MVSQLSSFNSNAGLHLRISFTALEVRTLLNNITNSTKYCLLEYKVVLERPAKINKSMKLSISYLPIYLPHAYLPLGENKYDNLVLFKWVLWLIFLGKGEVNFLYPAIILLLTFCLKRFEIDTIQLCLIISNIFYIN